MTERGNDFAGDQLSCPVCKRACSEDDAFCSACGTQVSGFVCLKCNHSYEPGNWKCPHCSTQMAIDPEWVRENYGPFLADCVACGQHHAEQASFCRKCGTMMPRDPARKSSVERPPLTLNQSGAGSAQLGASTGKISGSREIQHAGCLFAAAAVFAVAAGVAVDIPWWFIISGVLAAWVAFDAYQRKYYPEALGWVVFTFLVFFFILPFYLANRPLKAGERREGGKAWQVLRSFAIMWTLFIVFVTVWWFFDLADIAGDVESEAAQAGFGFGVMLGLILLGSLWFFPMFGAVVLGYFLKNSVVEEGPTGPLAEETPSEPVASPTTNPVTIAGVSSPPAQNAEPTDRQTDAQSRAPVDQSQAQCQNCGQYNEPNKKFCGDCGSRLPDITCPSCQAENSRSSKFCGDCGASLNPT